MATDPTQAEGRQPLSQATRKRLQQYFMHANKQAAQDSFDYATDLFVRCVLGDLNNRIYWEGYFGNLRKKYANNKKGAKLASIRTSASRASIKKAQMQKDWAGVIRSGLDVLNLNPWDAHALMAMAAAGEELGLDEVPLVFLKSALDAAPKDPTINRMCGHALRTRRQFNQAKACWVRVLEAKPDDQEAKDQIGDLTVEEMMDRSGMEKAKSSRDIAAKDDDAQHAASRHEMTAEQRLEQAIQENPTEIAPYLELAETYCRNENYAKAEEVLARACEASSDDGDIRERLEDVRLRRLRKMLHDAAAKAKQTGSDEAKKEWRELRKQYDQASLDAAKHRCDRYPHNLAFRFQLGQALQRVGECSEAIKEYQKARTDPRNKAECLLRLGQCFHKIKQYGLAARHYDEAIKEMGEQTSDARKDALYCAGALAIDLKELDVAEKHLTTLAGLDFGYKDVSALLDKIAQLRNTG
jgi:tetratricopeptide (TPR) repeat protein